MGASALTLHGTGFAAGSRPLVDHFGAMRHGHGMAQRPFWYPLSWWQALGVFFVAQIIANLSLAFLRERGIVAWPPWIGGGIGGALGVLGVTVLAKSVGNKEGSDGPKQ